MLRVYLRIISVITAFFIGSAFASVTLASSATLAPWQYENSMNTPRVYHTSVFVGDYIYVMGGSDGVDHVATVERAHVNSDGSLSSWVVMPPLTIARQHAAAVVANGYVYVSGGEQVPYGGPVDSVERAYVNSDFSLGPWELISQMPVPREHHSMIVDRGFLYIIGGYIGGPGGGANVIRAFINNDGSLGIWEYMVPLHVTRVTQFVLSGGNFIYTLGGEDATSFANLNSVEFARVGADGVLTSWQFTISMLDNRGYLGGALIGNDVYAVGGESGCSLKTVEKSTINSDGSLSTWETQSPMTDGRKGLTVVAAKGHLYAIGGGQNCPGEGNYLASVERARIISTPNPIVFIPGMTASYSLKGIIDQQDTTYSDWELIPKLTDPYYKPLFDTLKNSGLTDSGLSQNLFVFAYDWRQPISESAKWLNQFLQDKQVNNPGQKYNLVGHSMGGMIASYCYLLIDGCNSRINKIVYGGSPLRGAVDAYSFWETGDVKDADTLKQTVLKFVFQLYGLPQTNPVNIVHEKLPGVEDLLPIFDYKNGQNYASPDFQPRNKTLEELNNKEDNNFKNILTTFSGNNRDTFSNFDIVSPNNHEEKQGWWTDGKVGKKYYSVGDDTVLKASSEVPGADNNYYSLSHSDYFRNYESLSKLLEVLGLPNNGIITGAQALDSAIIVYTTSQVSVDLYDNFNEKLGTKDKAQKTIFESNLSKNPKKIVVTGLPGTNFEVNYFVFKRDQEPIIQVLKGKIGENSSDFLVI